MGREMRENIYYCIGCSNALHTQQIVKDSNWASTTITGLLYCLNEKCIRYALISKLGRTKKFLPTSKSKKGIK